MLSVQPLQIYMGSIYSKKSSSHVKELTPYKSALQCLLKLSFQQANKSNSQLGLTQRSPCHKINFWIDSL